MESRRRELTLHGCSLLAKQRLRLNHLRVTFMLVDIFVGGNLFPSFLDLVRGSNRSYSWFEIIP